ncbi:uncharacterized protein LOC134842839 [Symsagittifera roscoffensis]|uniref:uncharacterized protein LOC134842839 n=1 Tax=Symsagittifera roscoffensis TaxID=84072 RepID=UPI00307BA414
MCMRYGKGVSFLVEVGDYTRPIRRIEPILSTEVFYTEPWDTAESPHDVVAVVRVARPIQDISRYLKICQRPGSQGDTIGTCGLGQTSRSEAKHSRTLMEAYFSVSYLPDGFVPVVDQLSFCREKDICTREITPGAHSCLKDAGAPVYQFGCADSEDGFQYPIPKCLYGMVKSVKSFEIDSQGDYLGCKGPETFTNLTHYFPEIQRIIDNYRF